MNGRRIREHVYLVGAPFLTLCDYLMHRSLFFNKQTYENKVSERTRTAFINMCWDTHSAPEAREQLAECWKGYLIYRKSNQLHAKGLPVRTAGQDGFDDEEMIDRMQTAPLPSAVGQASASAAAGARAVAGEADGQGGGDAAVQG